MNYHKEDLKLRKKIIALLPDVWVRRVFRQPRTIGPGSMIVIETDEGCSFAQLQVLSEYFQTKDINMGSESREGGYCDTCAYSYSVAVITVLNAKEPDETTINPS